MLVQQVIERITERIRAATPPGTRIIAFGSVARGTAGPESDVDLLVIEPEQKDPYQEAGRLYRLMRGVKTPVDILVTDLATFETWKDTPCTVYNEAARDGVVLA